jgi:hypothetical protein
VWTATDSAGVTSGLGSRFFRVANGGSSGVTSAATATVSGAQLAIVPLDVSPLVARRSWEASAPWRNYGAGSSRRVVIRGEEIDRFELALGGDRGGRYSVCGSRLFWPIYCWLSNSQSSLPCVCSGTNRFFGEPVHVADIDFLLFTDLSPRASRRC